MAIIFKDSKQRSKVDHNHNYGGFWLDKSLTTIDYDGRTDASSVVKALKLRNYQKAIGNFVKILAQKDIPVIVSGTDSYTDGETKVVIAGNVSDKNFDVTAGLALHEASHIKYTDFQVLKDYMVGAFPTEHQMRVKNMLNWIEDRRIDTLVFKSCPGYKAYYHKLYDHYFRTKDIAKMLKGKQFRTETYDNYEAHIINMMNTEFDRNALQVLPQVVALIDVNNISRLKNTAEALEVAIAVVKLIEENLEKVAEQEDQQQQNQQQQPQGNEQTEDQEEGTGAEGAGEGDEDEEGNESDGQGSQEEGDEEEGDEEDDTEELSQSEMDKIQKALQEQKELLDGSITKKQAPKGIAKKVAELQNTETDFTTVGEGKYKNDCIVYRLDKESSKIAQLYTMNEMRAQIWKRYESNEIDYVERNRLEREHCGGLSAIKQNLPNGLTGYRQRTNEKYVLEGLQVGALLGRKLQTRRESRELVTNRLRTGKIDAKRIAHAGYGIENIFNQIHIDKYKNANIHLTIDASGSMGGERWNNSIKMAMALGKAVDMIEGLNIQVSMRETDNGDIPVVTMIYDSRINKLNHLKMILEMYNCNSMTPEGLCLEAMLKKKMFVPSNAEMDSYLINICDGAPGAGNYGGQSAIRHTKNQVKRINNELGIKHVGFFFGEDDSNSNTSFWGSAFARFKQMYGASQSKAIADANNATQIAQHMNKELMQK
jgi:hypothetical protein